MEKPSVLVVEDNEPTRMMISKLFSKQGWNVKSADTVAEGLRLLDPLPFCVIVDLLLPDGNGTAILSKIQESGQRTSVIVVATATSDVEVLGRAATYSPNLLIKKPFDWEVLWRYCDSEFRRANLQPTQA